MKIAQVAPLFESVPPKLYGGTERVVYWLTEELVRQGHDVTLFASGDSKTHARLVAGAPRSLRLGNWVISEIPHEIVQIEQVLQAASEFDIIHWHTDVMNFPYARRLETPNVNTLHGRLDIPDLIPFYHEYPDVPVVSISDAQRAPFPWINWQGTVYHGMPRDLLTPRYQRGQYLAFLGRISPEKGADAAIEIAKRTGMTLKIAAKISVPDQPYYEEVIKPLIEDASNVEFIGEINEKEKEEFLSNAYALLFPIRWPEPFGIVMIESMACGTPIVAFPGGSVQEVMQDGKSGYIVRNVEQAVQAVEKIATLDRRRVRRVFEDRFTDRRMARDYVAIYNRVIESKSLTSRMFHYAAPKGNGKSVSPSVSNWTDAPSPDLRKNASLD